MRTMYVNLVSYISTQQRTRDCPSRHRDDVQYIVRDRMDLSQRSNARKVVEEKANSYESRIVSGCNMAMLGLSL